GLCVSICATLLVAAFYANSNAAIRGDGRSQRATVLLRPIPLLVSRRSEFANSLKRIAPGGNLRGRFLGSHADEPIVNNPGHRQNHAGGDRCRTGEENARRVESMCLYDALAI